MKFWGIILSTLFVAGALLLPVSSAIAATDGFYQLAEVTAAWDGTDASRTKAPSASYDYTYGDEASLSYALPWSFSFYGQSYNLINVDTNGNVWFGSAGSAHSFIFPATGRGPVLAAWHNDLSSYYYGGAFVQHKPNPERVVIEWQAESYSEEGYYKPNNFEVVLFRNGTARIDYKSFTSTVAKDFGSGISKDDGAHYLNLTALYGNAFTLAGHSFAVADTVPPAVGVNPVTPLTNASAVTLTGTMEEGAAISIAADTSATIGTVNYPTATTWSCIITGLAEGTANHFTITATDLLQLSTSVPTVPSSITRDSIPPDLTIDPVVTPSRNASQTISGTMEAGAVVTVVAANGALVGAVAYPTSTTWNCTINLLEGPNDLTVTATDAVTNHNSRPASITLDTTPPPVIINSVTSPTRSRTQTISGSTEAGATVTVAVNTGATIGTVTYPSAANWEFTVNNLAAGDNIFTISARDQVGFSTTAAPVTIVYIPSVTLALSSTNIAADDKGTVGLGIGDIYPAGGEVLVEQFVDANRNGSIDAADYPIRFFKATDGAISTNPNIQGDEDGVANQTITTTLNYYFANDLNHAPGHYIFRVTKGADTAAVPFVVVPVPQPQTVSGRVTAGVNPIAGAMVRITDKWLRPVGFAVADETGSYTINVKAPGGYYVTPMAYGFAASTAAPLVAIAAEQTISNVDLTMVAGTYLMSGQVKDDMTGAGISGIWVIAKSADYTGIAMTAADGSYTLMLPAGQYAVSAFCDVTVPNSTAKGYLCFDNQALQVNLTADATGKDLMVAPSATLVSGRVLDQFGNAVAGLPVVGKIPLAADPRQPLAFGITNATGNYTLGLFTGDNWNILFNVPVTQMLGYLGTNIANVSTVNGPLVGNDLTAQPITAWVQGVVKDSNNNVLAGVEVQLRNADSTIVTTVKTASDGTYRLGAFAGNWLVAALTAAAGLSPVPERNVVLVDGQSATVDFTADAAVTLTAPVNGASFTSSATITLTATATAGGIATISKVEFYNSTALLGTAPTAPYSFSWANVPQGTYTLTAKAYNSLGATFVSAPVTVTVSNMVSPATDVTITAVTPASPSIPGTSVSFNALATGGSGTAEYQLWVLNPTTMAWTNSAYGTSPLIWTTTGLPAGTYNIQVWARNVGSTVSYEAYTTTTYTLAAAGVTPVSSVGLTSVSPASPSAPGTSVSFNALAAGGSGTAEYQLWVYNPVTAAWTGSAYGPSPLTWTTTGFPAGMYNIQVWARNVGSTASYEAYTDTTHTLGIPVSSVGITSVTPASPSDPGTSVSFNALATGGSGTAEYQLWVLNPTTMAWTNSAYGTSPLNWTTTGLPAGTYNIQVWARNSGSTAAYEAYTTTTYVIVTCSSGYAYVSANSR